MLSDRLSRIAAFCFLVALGSRTATGASLCVGPNADKRLS
jgi:hypothetical protein